MDSRYIDILIGIEEKKSQFQHYTSIFSFVKNTKLQLYESVMQNLNENYLVIKFMVTFFEIKLLIKSQESQKTSPQNNRETNEEEMLDR